MPGGLATRLLILTALAALLAAAPASAAAPGDRATAAAFRQATIDLHFTVTQQGPAIAQALKQIDSDSACTAAIERIPDEQLDATALGYILPFVLEVEFDPLRRSFAAFSAKLDTIQVRDPQLRSGRAAWREMAVSFGRISPPPTDFCARVKAWRQAGYPAASRPEIQDPLLDELVSAESRLGRNLKKVERSGRRLRALGVSKRVVGWWTLDTLLDDLEPGDALQSLRSVGTASS